MIRCIFLSLLFASARASSNVPLETISVAQIRPGMKGYGLTGAVVDGNKVEDLRRTVESAADIVRDERHPFMVECMTTRLSRHKLGQGDVRSKEELAVLALRDPLLAEAKRLDLSPEQIAREAEAALDQVQRAISAALAVPIA